MVYSEEALDSFKKVKHNSQETCLDLLKYKTS